MRAWDIERPPLQTAGKKLFPHFQADAEEEKAMYIYNTGLYGDYPPAEEEGAASPQDSGDSKTPSNIVAGVVETAEHVGRIFTGKHDDTESAHSDHPELYEIFVLTKQHVVRFFSTGSTDSVTVRG